MPKNLKQVKSVRNSAQIILILTEHQKALANFDVKSLSIFGSFARGEANTSSDVDFLIEFSKPVGMFRFYDVKVFLEKILGRTVDLVSVDAVRSEFREQIEKEKIRAA